MAHRFQQDNGASIDFQQIIGCPVCKGKGVVVDEACAKCGGSGRVEHESAVRVRVPAGIEDGTTLRIPGHGVSAEPGAELGDLHMVPLAPVFSASVLICGGPRASPSRTQYLVQRSLCRRWTATWRSRYREAFNPMQYCDQREKGLPRHGTRGRGDLNLRMQVHIPRTLTPPERKLFEQLRDLHRREPTE